LCMFEGCFLPAGRKGAWAEYLPGRMKDLFPGGGCSGEDKSGGNRVVDNGHGSGVPVEWRARDACLERAGLREDYGLHGEAWVLVLQATAL